MVVRGVGMIDSTSVADNCSWSGFSFVMPAAFLAAFVTSFRPSDARASYVRVAFQLTCRVVIMTCRVLILMIVSSVVLQQRSTIHFMQDMSRLS